MKRYHLIAAALALVGLCTVPAWSTVTWFTGGTFTEGEMTWVASSEVEVESWDESGGFGTYYNFGQLKAWCLPSPGHDPDTWCYLRAVVYRTANPDDKWETCPQDELDKKQIGSYPGYGGGTFIYINSGHEEPGAQPTANLNLKMQSGFSEDAEEDGSAELPIPHNYP